MLDATGLHSRSLPQPEASTLAFERQGENDKLFIAECWSHPNILLQ